MERPVLGSLLLLLLACSGTNVVAGQEQTTSEQFASGLPSFCQKTCAWLTSCSQASTDCSAQCSDYFAPFTNTGDVCAAVGQRVQDCLGKLTCSDLNKDDPCAISAEEKHQCPDTRPGIDSGSASAGGPSSGETVSGTTGNPTVVSGGIYAIPVSCNASSTSARAMPIKPGPAVVCEAGRDECSSGHTYDWVCSEDSQGRRSCSCFFDSSVTGGFEPSTTPTSASSPTADCPILAEVNAGCGWQLTQ